MIKTARSHILLRITASRQTILLKRSPLSNCRHMSNIEPVQIIEESDSELTIAWSDGSETKFNAPDLRRACPCAGCVDEWTGKKTLDGGKIANDLISRRSRSSAATQLKRFISPRPDTGIFQLRFLEKNECIGKSGPSRNHLR